MLVIYNCVSKCFTLKITVVQCVLWKLINGKKFSWTFNMASNLPKPCTLKKWTAEFKWLESCNNYTYCQICMNWQKKLLVQTTAVHLLWKVATTGEEVHSMSMSMMHSDANDDENWETWKSISEAMFHMSESEHQMFAIHPELIELEKMHDVKFVSSYDQRSPC